MALINCYECGKQISDAAPACPSCGAPKKKITLHKSCEIGDIEAVKQHLASGADAKDEDGDTPLNYTVGETADLLRKNGGKSGTEDSIHLAVQVGNIEAVKQHIAAGADVNAGSDDGARQRGWTPLHIAAIFGHKEITVLLIAEGADVNAKNKWGSTPLNQTAERGHKEIAELLIAKGADVNAKAEDGETPLDATIEFRHPQTANLLSKHGGKTGEELKAEGK
jgi:ankyrin repeat protein